MGDEKISIYSNSIDCNFSAFEFKLGFNLETPQTDGNAITEHLADVRISPQLAKALCAILQQSVKLYEDSVGVIAIPGSGSNE